MLSNTAIKSLYFGLIHDKIKIILSRTEKTELTFDILDSERSKQGKIAALHEKQRQMKVGEIMQMVLGNYDKFENLGTSHSTGLDIISKDRKIIAEIKNRTNTDNAASRKTNRDKLAKFKKTHPEYECIYGMINTANKKKTMAGSVKTITHDGVEIKEYVGMALLRHILGEDTEAVVEFVKKTIDEHIILAA